MEVSTLIFWGVLIALAFYLITLYNRLVTLQKRVENALSQIEVQLKRRYDLIPNLVATAKGYLNHERDTLEAVINARNDASSKLEQALKKPGDTDTLAALARSERNLQASLGKLQIQVENYPELKANTNMMQLAEELTATENKVAFARQAYNDAATDYNTYRNCFPQIVLASQFGHRADVGMLEFEDAEAIRHAPNVAF